MSPVSVVYKSNCRYFRGDIPCKPHKENGYHCIDCPAYSPVGERILIIKLGAAGDVIRTTPLLRRIKSEHPLAEIWWITQTPELISSFVDRPFMWNFDSILAIRNTSFHKVINLDKDIQACALASAVESEHKYGFILSEGKPAPVNESAKHKFLTGIFDNVNKENTKSYPQEIFEICNWEFNGEEYLLNCDRTINWEIPNSSAKIIGLNTGCGARWTSRLWRDIQWIELAQKLSQNGLFPLLLGGKQEDGKNRLIAQASGAYYPGYFELTEFISLVDQCHLVVTAVTMGLHIAIGLRKPVVLMNNIFNRNEFELFGRGEIVEPDLECKCFFRPECINPDYFCMDKILPERVYEAVKRNMKL